MQEKQDINSLIKFSPDLLDLVTEVQELQSELYSAEPFLWPSDKASDLRSFLDARGVNVSAKNELIESLNKLQEEISNLERIKVIVPDVQFSSEFWDRLFHWLKENLISRSFILDKETSPAIMGGIVIYWQGSYIDLSLKTKLGEFFSKAEHSVKTIQYEHRGGSESKLDTFINNSSDSGEEDK